MNPSTPHFSESSRGSEAEAARRIAGRLNREHPDLAGFIYSAASYLIRDGQRPSDRRVLEEARRRRKLRDRAIERNRRRFGADQQSLGEEVQT